MSNEKKPAKAIYKTLTEIMAAPARESMPIVARIAPAMEQIAAKTGILSLMFSETVALATNAAALAKLNEGERAAVRADMAALGEQVTLKLLGSIGSCMPEYQEILAALNGITVDELLDNYTAKDIIEMIKAVITDNDFLASLRTLTS